MLKKIVIIGPESTGKSTLSEQLAKHFETIHCPEFARNFLLSNGIKYSYDDLLTIAQGQTALEDECCARIEEQFKPLLEAGAEVPFFIDTDMYVMKVWCEVVFNRCHPFVLNEITRRRYDLYLLCNIDLPWVKDELREYPDYAMRNRLYKTYQDILINQQTPWVEISGTEEERLRKALTAVKTIGI